MASSIPDLQVLFFDVFGTCVAQLSSIADEFSRATNMALVSNTPSINEQVRTRAKKMSYDHWIEFATDWNKAIDALTRRDKIKTGNVDWEIVDKYRLETLYKLLEGRGFIIPSRGDARSESDLLIEEGSLFNEQLVRELAFVWHRLTPWPDTCHGVELLNKKFSTAALSNTYNGLLKKLVSHGNIPFKHVYSADMFNSYKPNAKVYLGAAEKLGVKPENCALVAAHLSDLQGAKACGFYAIYVERPSEEKSPGLRGQNIPDLVIEPGQKGLITLAERLGLK